MAITISVCLQKGGTCKTSTALNLVSILGYRHKKTLLIDLDSQCDSTYFSGIDNSQYTIYDLLGDGCTAKEAIQSCKYYDLLPASQNLTKIELSEEVEPTLLKDTISSLKNKYDYIIIDTPPALGNLSFNALIASDYVLIPTEPRPAALRGIQRLHGTITSIQEHLNPSLQVIGILLCRYSNRTILSRDLKNMIEDYARLMDTTIFITTIREGIAVAEAQTVRQPLIDYAPSSKPNIDYKGFVSELLKRIGE